MKKNSFLRNMSWIMVGNIVHAVLSFLVSIIVTRHISVDDNGIINYATSWISFFSAIAALGVNNVINKFTSDDIDASRKYLSTAIIFRTISGIVATICVVLTVIVLNPDEKSIIVVTLIQSMVIVFSAGDTLVYWFRFKRDANIVAIIRLIAFVIPAILKLVSVVLLKNIYIYTVGIVSESLLFSLLLIIQFRKQNQRFLDVSSKALKEIISISYPFVFSAVLSVIYAQTDRIMLKNMLDNASVGYYSVAVTLAGLMSVVISAIIEGFRPEIIASKNRNQIATYEKRLIQSYAVIFWICILYGIFINVFGKYLVVFLYGNKYLPSAKPLALIVWYTSFSHFGTINNIYLVSEGNQKLVQVTTLVGAATNVILNFLLIPQMGVEGAALASLITQFVANLLTPALIPKYRPVLSYMIKGVLLKVKGV